MSLVYCRRCRAAAVVDQWACRSCGAWDPGGGRVAAVGALVVGTLVAAAVTGGYTLAMSHEWVWERWQRKFDSLPDDHALRGHAWDVAFVLSVAVLVVSWLLAVVGLGRVVRDQCTGQSPPRNPSRPAARTG
jgi:hypothetical protein